MRPVVKLVSWWLGIGFGLAAWPGGAQELEVHPPREREFRSLELFLTGGQDGRLAHVECRRGGAPRGDELRFAQQAASYRRAAEEARRRDRPLPLAVNLGNTVFPGPVGRYLLSRIPNGPGELAGILAGVPYAAFGLGAREVNLPWPQLGALLNAADEAGLPLLIDNLECPDGSEHPLCRWVATREPRAELRLVEAGDLRIGFLAVLDPGLHARIAPHLLAEVAIRSPEEVLATKAPELRSAGADLVVALAHLAPDRASERALVLARSSADLDLVLTTRLAELERRRPATAQGAVETQGHLVAAETGVVVLSADSGPEAVVLADLELTRAHRQAPWTLHALHSRRVSLAGIEPHPEVSTRLQHARNELCDSWGGAIAAGVRVERPFELEDFQLFVLNVLRFSTGAELALMNAGAFRNGERFPFTGELTLADLYTALPFDDTAVVLKLPGSSLADLAEQLGTRVAAAGLARDGQTTLVNGRPVMPHRSYRIVVNRFVAEGGDEIFARAGMDPVEPDLLSDEPPAIRDLVATFIRDGHYREGGPFPHGLSPEGNFPDLAARFLWTTTATVGASYNRVDVDNPLIDGDPAFDQPQLTVRSTDQIHLNGEIGLVGDSRLHGVEGELVMHYAAARLDRSEGRSGFEETRDTVLLRGVYKYLGFRTAERDEWWIPLPFVEIQLESEFVRPEERDWRRFQVTGIGGARFRLLDPLEAKLGLNVRRDLEDPAGRTTYGINLGYVLHRTEVASILERPVRLDSSLEYFFNDIGSRDIQEVRNLNRVHFALNDRLFFTTSLGFFGYRSSEVGRWGTNTQITLGLSFLWETARQRF